MTKTVPRPRRAPIALLLAGAALAPALACALDTGRAEVAGFVEDMASRHGFDAASLASVLEQARTRQPILDAMSRPAERRLDWSEYRGRFITERRVQRGVDTYRDRRGLLEQAASSGVPATYLLAIVGVETSYGENTGRHRVIDALATLAFDYPARAAFFRGELEQFLLMTREESLDPLAPLGSYAGAMGIPQFMPTSFRSFAVDGDGDGHRDLWSDWADVFASVGNYLKAHGWQAGAPVLVEAAADPALMATLDPRNLQLDDTVAGLRDRGIAFEAPVPPETAAILLPAELQDRPNVRVGFRNFHVITRYNRSIRYAMAVHDLAQAISARATAPES